VAVALPTLVAQAAPLFCQVPVPSHVWGCRPLHCTAPGVQTPEQLPAEQTYSHEVGLPHCPLELQVSTESPIPPSPMRHCPEPGVHTPVHEPLTHTYWQAEGPLHVPRIEQVSTPLPEHCVAPGVQKPAHDPLLHTNGHALPVLCQLPVTSHVCGC